MWTRKELKQKAKEVVKRNYWTAIIICFLVALLTGEFGTSIVGIWQSEDSMDPNYIIHKEEKNNSIIVSEDNIHETLNKTPKMVLEVIEANLNSATKSQKYIFKIYDAITSFNINKVDLGIALIIAAGLAFCFTIFIADPLIVGGKKYFLKARKENNNAKVGIIVEDLKMEIG